MDKENGEGDPAAKPPPDGLLDPSGLFGAYWGRDGASAAQAQAQAQAALFGFGSRYQPPTTLGVAANQAASLSLHPAASAAWWSMASHLAAQDYLARLQASGLSFPPLADPYAALSALAAGKHKPKAPRNDGRSGRSSSGNKDKSPASGAQPAVHDWGSTYGFPKTSLPSQGMSSLASLNSLAQQPHAKHKSTPPRKSSNSSSNKEKESRELMLAHSAYHAALTKGKGMSSLYPFGAPSDKDRRGIDSFTGLPHTILSAALEGGDPSSVLGGVRLPPDTEIIKYTSSLAGPKLAPGSTTRGRKKTISLDPPRVSVHPAGPPAHPPHPPHPAHPAHPAPSKRQKVDEFGNSRSSVEVIRLPNKPDRNNVATPPPNLSDYAGISRELLQTIASQSGVSLAALERQLQPAANDSGLNLSTKLGNNSDDTPLDLGLKDEDAPLNLSLKPTPPSSQASDALSRLTSLSSSLSASNDRISRRKPGAKPRRVAPDAHDSPRPKSSGSEDSESHPTWPSREGRPRNLGRGVSKPKKNTVASLLAQSRALGLRPALAQQLLAETDLDKLRLLLGESASTDSDCPSDSNPSDSDTSDGGRRHNDSQLRLPLALGWKRITVIKGLSRNCNIKGDVSYTPPEPHAGIALKNTDELNAFLESNPSPPLSRDSFSFSARVVLGEYLQSTHDAEPLVLTEAEITKRLEEARALGALGGRPTPPPLERRMELARRQQAARDARRDPRARDQARLVRELERSEKAEIVKREKEARSAHLLEQINKSRSQLTIEPLPQKNTDEWKIPEIVMGPATRTVRDKTMPQISLSLIPVSGYKDNSPIKTLNLDQNWKGEVEEYNALDKMKDFAEKASFDLPKRPNDRYFDFSLTKTADKRKAPDKENNLDKLIESYSRISEFINGCDWSKLQGDKRSDDPKSLEQKYLDAKNEFMSQNLMLMPKDGQRSVLREVIDLSGDDDILNDIITKKINRGTFNVGKDGALSISVQPCKDASPAKKRKQEELEKQKTEDQAKRQQEREFKRHQAMLLKEQERERRRQHTAFIRQLDSRRRWEERERRKHQNLLDRLLAKEKKLQQRRKEMELLAELRRPQEDSSLSDHKPLPDLERIPGLRIPGQAMADLLQVYEFLHNFGQGLGFEVESLPTLDTLQMGLIPTCSQEAEEELMNVLTKLLVIAIEEPGIPHPGRHTTLLGHALRLAELTPDTLSEVLRIYLYACATAEVKALTGLTVERERDRRVADHHQSDAEMQMTFASSKNTTYYEHLHSNATYKLSELLRDKPFLSLRAASKARVMARVCDELLQSRAVLRQLDASLDHLAQLRRDRYLLDTRIRKVRVLQQRKARAEATERQQAAALDRMQRLVDESHAHTNEHDQEKPETPKKECSPEKPNTPSPFKDESDKELSPLKDLGKKMLNNNKEDDVKDKDDVMADCDGMLSDLESEGTQPEEDEDKNLSSEELSRKLEKLLRQSEQQLLALAAGSHELRATCYGQDRYWRRYWSLGKAGGVLVEALESAQPETRDYHDRRERAALAKEQSDITGSAGPGAEPCEADEEAEALELRSIKHELNLSDRTQIIKYETNLTHGACKVEGSIKMEEKYIQHKQNNEEEDMLDIEDSIPTAFLVQKPTHKPMFAQQAEQIDKPQEIVKVENIVKNEVEKEDEKENTVNNLDELRKMAEAVSSQLDAAKKAEAEKLEIETKLEESKQAEVESAHNILYARMLEGKWFSILRHESSFLNSINDKNDAAVFCDNEHTCSEVINCQGHKWDVSNNLHLLNDPSLFTLNSMVTSVQVPSNNVYADSSLTMSGLDQDVLDSSLSKDGHDVDMEDSKELETDVDKEVQAVTKDISQKTKASNLSSLGLLNFNALSTYVTCDSPPPIQMSADELEQLENAKIHGLPKKVEGTFVPKELRHGWWRISQPEQLQALLQALHPRGARERELLHSLTHLLPTLGNKPYIDPGSPSARLSCSAAELEEEPYPAPDAPGSFCALTARRVDMQLLAMVEALEERVAAASMQVKGWRAARLALPAAATGAEIVARARHKLASLEAHIERRYLKPPLVQSSSEALGAALQADGATHEGHHDHKTDKGISRGLSVWREAVSRCNTSAQLAMLLHALEQAVAWDKSIMKANCQFCLSGDNEDQLLLCDGCDKGYHTYCFKPRMEKIPEGDWYCWECVNKARGVSRERVCIVCGGAARGRAVPCALCVRAYHLDCHYPPLLKMPRGKWYCSQCASRAPARRPRKGKRDKNKDNDLDAAMVPSPAASHASTSTTAEEGAPPAPEPERDDDHDVSGEPCEETHASGNGALLTDTNSEDHESENLPLLSRAKKEKNSAKKQLKEMQFCKNLLCEMECHEHAWPFLVPVNTKQFPQYRKVIKCPMDLSTIKRKLHESGYKCKEEFASDVRLIFSNCEVFNEDESPVGRAGHCMREFFERRWEHA